jgi:hypothetical protein
MPIDFRNDRNGADPPTGSHLPNGGGAQPGSGLPRYADDPIVSRVRWVGAPTYAQVTAAYPEKARLARASGHVALNCPILRTRRLGHCDVISEFPRGLGFGGAAQALAADFVAPGAESGAGAGRLVGAHTQIAFTFAAEMLDNTTHIVGKPEWSRLPEALDVAQGFPAAATAAHVATGHIVLSCAIESGGILSDCMVEKQTPDGLGFGDAALALSTRFQVSVWTDEGLPTVGGRVRVPIRYDADSASSPPPPADLTLETAKITGLRRPLAPPPTTGPAKPASGALRYYPEHAQMAGVTGDTTLRCRIRAATLTLGDCRVIAETPTGEGFGDKSIALVDFGVRLQPRMLDRLKAAGKTPDGASAEVSFQFRLRDGDATPSP